MGERYRGVAGAVSAGLRAGVTGRAAKSRVVELEPVKLLAEGTVRPDCLDLYSSIAE